MIGVFEVSWILDKKGLHPVFGLECVSSNKMDFEN
jgi:hypothetical protein